MKVGGIICVADCHDFFATKLSHSRRNAIFVFRSDIDSIVTIHFVCILLECTCIICCSRERDGKISKHI